MATLHITNGESAGGTLRQTALGGEVLCWNDVLHEGPVPALPEAELRDVRARFLSNTAGLPFAQVQQDLARRDATLASFTRYEEVCLWFEHDLYDQLQLLQILNWFQAQPPLGNTQLNLINIHEHPEVKPFHGLGQLNEHQLAALYPAREPVLDTQLDLAHLVWRAFTSPDPTHWTDLLNENLTALPYLRAAWQRMLQQFPSAGNGLNRTERQILDAVAAAPISALTAFTQCAAKEEAVFLGDTTFFEYVDELRQEPGALLVQEKEAGQLHLTPLGEQVRAGRADWLQHHPIDRWYGGVHLRNDQFLWRWE